MRVAVLMGGPSAEHAISIRSGEGVVAALRRYGWSVEPLVIPQESSTEQACNLVEDWLVKGDFDVVFLALHGPFGEDGTVQALCEQLGVAYTGSDAQASRLGMDKMASRSKLELAGLAVPKGIEVRCDTLPQDIPLSYPVVVKPVEQGSSVGISLVERREALTQALVVAGQYGRRILIEEFVAGPELTVGVVGDTALPIIEIRPHQRFFDFTAKYTAGMTDYIVPAILPPQVAEVVSAAGLAAHHALGCRHLSRADFILKDGKIPVLLEVNTIPGFTPTSLVPKAAAAVGISYDDLCERLLTMALGQKDREAQALIV